MKHVVFGQVSKASRLALELNNLRLDVSCLAQNLLQSCDAAPAGYPPFNQQRTASGICRTSDQRTDHS